MSKANVDLSVKSEHNINIRRWAMRKHIALFVLVLSFFVVLAGVASSASEELRITFPRPLAGMSSPYHGNTLVVVHYRMDDKNRELDLSWDSPDGESGRSVTDISPQNDGIPVTKDLNLSAGEYTFVATLYRSDGTKVVATQTRFVIDR